MQFFEEKINRKTPLDFEETEKSVFFSGRSDQYEGGKTPLTTKQKKHFFSMSQKK